MADRARVTSVEALEAFRAHLIVYLSKARPAIEEVGADLARVRAWLETDQRRHWEREVHRRTRNLENAEQALLSARLSTLRDAPSVEQAAVHRARRHLAEGHARLRAVRQWARDFPHRSEPVAKQIEGLHSVLARDVIQAIAWLGEAVKTLEGYTATAPPAATPPPQPPDAAPAPAKDATP